MDAQVAQPHWLNFDGNWLQILMPSFDQQDNDTKIISVL